MSTHIGVIAEEQSDVDVLYELTCKLVPEHEFHFDKFLGHGCGKLRRKCHPWAINLLRRGCSHLVVLHDLDCYSEAELRRELEAGVRDVGFDAYVVVLPAREIEAWLLADSLALKTTFSMRRVPTTPKHPETLTDPKTFLTELVWRSCSKRYVNTLHNRRIAALTRLTRLSVCSSFAPYPRFIAHACLAGQ